MTADHDHARREFLRAIARTGLVIGGAGTFGSTDVSLLGARRNDMAFTQQEISDRLEINDLLVRYCYAVDDRDWDAYRRVFTSDAVLDDTITGGIRSGVEEHVAFMKKALSKILISQHAISTILLDIKGAEASARVHCSCPMVVDLGEGKTHVFFQGLWYRDRLVRTPNGWRIRELMEEGY
jgi:SnoaL-like protein